MIILRIFLTSLYPELKHTLEFEFANPRGGPETNTPSLSTSCAPPLGLVKPPRPGGYSFVTRR